MSYREFRNLALATLDSQKVYFMTRTVGDLDKAKSMERLLRKTIKDENMSEGDDRQLTIWGPAADSC